MLIETFIKYFLQFKDFSEIIDVLNVTSLQNVNVKFVFKMQRFLYADLSIILASWLVQTRYRKCMIR